MLWYNTPQMERVIMNGRGSSTIDEGNRLMRLVRSNKIN